MDNGVDPLRSGWIITEYPFSSDDMHIEVSIGRNPQGLIWYYERIVDKKEGPQTFITLVREYGERSTVFYTSGWIDPDLGDKLNEYISHLGPGEATLAGIEAIFDNFKMEDAL